MNDRQSPVACQLAISCEMPGGSAKVAERVSLLDDFTLVFEVVESKRARPIGT